MRFMLLIKNKENYFYLNNNNVQDVVRIWQGEGRFRLVSVKVINGFIILYRFFVVLMGLGIFF